MLTDGHLSAQQIRLKREIRKLFEGQMEQHKTFNAQLTKKKSKTKDEKKLQNL